MRAAALLLTAVLMTGCVGSSGQPRDLPSPVGDHRSEELPDGMVRFWPRSAPVDEGVEYRMNAYTHCGLDFLLDFDTSFWVVDSSPEGAFVDDPEDEGIIRLVSEDRAVYVSAAGDEFGLIRTEGPRDAYYCE